MTNTAVIVVVAVVLITTTIATGGIWENEAPETAHKTLSALRVKIKDAVDARVSIIGFEPAVMR